MRDKPIWFVSPEDLILSKLMWANDSGSELQMRDVSQLILSAKDLDKDYLSAWAETLGVWLPLKRQPAMRDTPPEIQQIMRELYSALTCEERLEMAAGMFDAAVELAKAGILNQNPDISDSDLRWKLFCGSTEIAIPIPKRTVFVPFYLGISSNRDARRRREAVLILR